MGEQEGWAEPNGLLPNGLLPNLGEEIRVLDTERWLKAEERIAELIACIQPNEPSEERRNAVADYVQRLIMKCFPCQVFTFGSVPLKTYLPDGDIDLTAFSNNQTLKDTWAHQVRDMLENEEKNAQAEFRVKEVQYIQAEVKIIKCLVENIVVDISFNQLGGLCTLCFLEEVDHLINHNHLFKRSIILIKAWCYYESRILGAHHGLISTYALETLVLYIFHVFNNSFTGPLEVLYRFLEFFSKFDWDNFCVSLWGPVPISSLPDVTAESPRKDGGNLLLSKLFLDACSTVYAVFPSGPENQSQPFLPKNFNVIDPLRVNNNLGRSVSKGNFYRIRSAFAFGAKRLARLLDCPNENLINEVNQFFKNTWERHGSGRRPDAPKTDNLTKSDNRGRKSPVTNSQPNHFHGSNSRRNDLPTNSSTPHVNVNSSRASDARESTSSNHVGYVDEGQRNKKSDHLVNNINGRFTFARTHSSPELSYMSTKVRRHRVLPEGSKSQTTSTRLDGNNRKPNQPSTDDFSSSVKMTPSPQGGVDVVNEELGTLGMNQEQQDLVNMMESTTLNHFNGQVPLPFTIPPSFLASLGYTQRNLPGSLVPSIPNMHFPHGLVPQPFALESNPNLEYCSEQNSNENFCSVEAGNGFWQDQDATENGEPLYDERTASSRFSSASHSNSLRSRVPEGSWDGSSAKVSKSMRERRGKKVGVAEFSGTYGKGKTMPEHTPNYIEDDEHEWDEVPGSEVMAQTSSSEPNMISGTQMFTGSGSLARDNSALVAFIPTGPPVPFITMLPVYDDIGSETGGAPDTSLNFDTTEGLDNSEDKYINTSTISNEYKPDILNSDFASHFQNMQFGRFCQNPPNPGPMFYQTPVMIPPGYLQGRFPWDGPGRPLPTNFNLLTQLMGGGGGGGGYGSRVGPVAPLQSLPNRPLPNVYQRFADDIPKHRSGTGTYLPNPKVLAVRDRPSSNPRRVNYHYDQNDRDGNWNTNSKTRAGGGGGGGGGGGRVHNNNRNQSEKSNSRLDRLSSMSENRGGADRSWTGGPYRNEPVASSSSSFTAQNGPPSFRAGPPNVASAYGPNSSVPSVVMMYPFEHEQLEFGSLGPVGGVSSEHEPSSPRRRHHRRN